MYSNKQTKNKVKLKNKQEERSNNKIKTRKDE
jgi:hypothetical protein